MNNAEDIPPIGLGTLLRALLSELEPAVEQAYAAADPRMRSRYYPILRHLICHGEASVGRIAAAVGVSQPAMTQTIRQMVDDGLLDVSPGADRRARRVRMSEVGAAMVQELRPVWRAVADAARTLERDSGVAIHTALDSLLGALAEKDFATRIAEAKGSNR